MNKLTCGELFDAVVNQLLQGGPTLDFYIGFVAGHAEKIHLGAALASVFRPPEEWSARAAHAIGSVCGIYGLYHKRLHTNRGVEIWIFREHWVGSAITAMGQINEDEPPWHQMRAWLTGVKPSDVDIRYHERYRHERQV